MASWRLGAPFNRRRGFTLAELLIGLSVSAIVLTALAAAAYAVAQCWESDDGTQQLAIQAEQVSARVRHYLSGAQYIGLVHPGSLDGSAATPGCIFFWMADNWNGAQDCGPEWGEMAAIQHDPATGSLYLYKAEPVASMSSTDLSGAGSSISWSQMNDPVWLASFENPSAIPYISKTKIGSNVTGATFAVNWLSSTTQRPMVEVTLVLTRSPQQPVTQYAGILLRSPSTQPSP